MTKNIFGFFGFIATFFLASVVFSQEKTADETAPAIRYGLAALTDAQRDAGALLLFDGQTLFGWTAEPVKPTARAGTPSPRIEIKNGAAHITTTVPIRIKTELLLLRPFRMELTYRTSGETSATLQLDAVSNMYLKRYRYPLAESDGSKTVRIEAVGETGGPIRFDDTEIEAAGNAEGRAGAVLIVEKGTLVLESFTLTPASRPLWNGTLDAWKTLGDIKAEPTGDGAIHLTGGSGSLESSEEFDDFFLSLDFKENASPNNSGLFFRTIPASKMDGYEAQMNNLPPDADRAKFLGNDTGSIFRRAAARRLVTNPSDWTRLTVMAEADFFRTWVNGVPALCWTDTREANENPRKGRRFKRGTIQIQGHDPATDLLLRNIRVLDNKGGTFE